jgi:2-keto-4-pentenoate hydratase/2-oxohepta-3-ene-1,7-dioic acid hydratase in catechol pathway
MKKILHDNEYITPSKVICIGRNYVEHIKELNNETPDSMVIFNKPNSAISNELLYFSEDTRFEAEISFLIKNNKIDGVGFGLDLTKANIQDKLKLSKLPWERAKSFDKSAVFGNFVKIEDDISELKLELFINEKLTQLATIDLMIYKPLEIIEEIKSFMTLEDGDIIMTGTPKGVGTYKMNDIFVAKLYNKGKLINEYEWIVK